MSYINKRRPAPTSTSALGGTDYHDGKIPGSGSTISWENPSFSWWNDPFGTREAAYLRDRAAYFAKLKDDKNTAALVASAKQTIETLNSAFDAANHGGVAVPSSMTPAFVPPSPTPLLGGGSGAVVKIAAVGLLGAGAFMFLRRRR